MRRLSFRIGQTGQGGSAIGTATCKQHGPLQMDDTHNIVRCDFFMAQEIGAAVIGLVCGNSKGCSATGNP